MPRKAHKVGLDCFTIGAVRLLECIEQDAVYAAVVREGGEDHEVALEWEGIEWLTNCTCLRGDYCPHTVAALLELRRQAANDTGSASGPTGAGRPGPNKAATQPPRSPLSEKVLAALGRPMQSKESAFVRQVQAAFGQARLRSLNESDLAPLTIANPNPLLYSYYKPLELWPQKPSDDFTFWLHIAWELRRRGLQWPAFMDPITDLAQIEPTMLAWERAKEIDQWRERFRAVEARPTVAHPDRLELRLMVLKGEARLQWRLAADAAFADLKQAQARRLAEQFQTGALSIEPGSLPLWSAAYQPYVYESWWSFKYASDQACKTLNRLLRLPFGPERLVNAESQPLPRPSEPLRLDLQAPENGADLYQLALVTADAAPVPPILCVLEGEPTLYLTQVGLFSGPSCAALEGQTRQSIPAPALESAEGLNFLHASRVPLPPHLQERVRTVAARVKISCSLKAPYAGSPTEDLILTVTASAPGMTQEQFTAYGWDSRAGYQPHKPLPPLKSGVVTVVDRQPQQLFPRLLEPLGLKWDPYPGQWRLRVTKKLPETFVPWVQSLPPEIDLVLDAQLATLRNEPVSGQVSLEVDEAGIDWFDIRVALQVTDTRLTPEELRLLLGARGGYVRLGKKGWRRLQFNLSPEEDEQLARLGLNPRDFSAEPQRLHALQLADEAAHRFLGPDRMELIQQRARELKARVSPALPSAIRAELRPYQTEGFHFLSYLAANRFGGVLADDMGLGKTLQTLAWLAWLRDAQSNPQPEAQNQGARTAEPGDRGQLAGPSALPSTPHAPHLTSEIPTTNPFIHPSTHPAPSPALVVCPKSVMDNWHQEAQRFYPQLRVRLWHGEPGDELAPAREKTDLLVLNYAQLRSLATELAAQPWLAVILDEAQYIKNPDSQTAQAVRALKGEYRLALTGTPIENRLLDLWSIMSFAMPGALGNRHQFLRRFDAKDDPLARRRLAARVRPFLLRRTKTQVAQDLPDRIEEDLHCELEGRQKTLYQAELKRARRLLLGLTTNQQLNQQRFSILTSLLRLRQICCHPVLVDQSLHQAESAKLAALEELLEPLMEEGHKVLVFSQFVTMLELIRDTVTRRGWKHFYLAGDTDNRGELVRQFQTAEGAAAFLISLKAGGFGLNLTAASYVVLFDPWWNPAVENQAVDRTHRIGQTRKVIAYRLLMRESIEQKIRLLQKQKAALMEDVLGEERFSQSLTLEDLRVLFAD